MSVMAFTPMGNTITFTANVAAPAAVQAVPLTPGPNQYRIKNSGTVDIFLGYGANATAANTMANANIVGQTLVVGPGVTEVFSLTANLYFTAVSTASCSVYITPGDGL